MRTCTIYHLQCTMGLRLGEVNVNVNVMVIVCYNKEKKIVHLKLYIVNGKL